MRVAKCLTVSLILVLLVPGIAEALVEVRTRTTLKASEDEVSPGTTVNFTGKLESDRAACYMHQSIHLYENGAPIGVVSSGSTGSFSFSRQVLTTSTYKAVFEGAIVGTHPNQKICKASQGKTRVEVCEDEESHDRWDRGWRPFEVRSSTSSDDDDCD